MANKKKSISYGCVKCDRGFAYTTLSFSYKSKMINLCKFCFQEAFIIKNGVERRSDERMDFVEHIITNIDNHYFDENYNLIQARWNDDPNPVLYNGGRIAAKGNKERPKTKKINDNIPEKDKKDDDTDSNNETKIELGKEKEPLTKVKKEPGLISVVPKNKAPDKNNQDIINLNPNNQDDKEIFNIPTQKEKTIKLMDNTKKLRLTDVLHMDIEKAITHADIVKHIQECFDHDYQRKTIARFIKNGTIKQDMVSRRRYIIYSDDAIKNTDMFTNINDFEDVEVIFGCYYDFFRDFFLVKLLRRIYELDDSVIAELSSYETLKSNINIELGHNKAGILVNIKQVFMKLCYDYYAHISKTNIGLKENKTVININDLLGLLHNAYMDIDISKYDAARLYNSFYDKEFINSDMLNMDLIDEYMLLYDEIVTIMVRNTIDNPPKKSTNPIEILNRIKEIINSSNWDIEFNKYSLNKSACLDFSHPTQYGENDDINNPFFRQYITIIANVIMYMDLTKPNKIDKESITGYTYIFIYSLRQMFNVMKRQFTLFIMYTYDCERLITLTQKRYNENQEVFDFFDKRMEKKIVSQRYYSEKDYEYFTENLKNKRQVNWVMLYLIIEKI